jgi:2-dehydropantoate 2-reductase
MSIQNVAVVGVGGVGGYFGGKLCRLLQNGCGVNISFIARGEHLRAIQQSGLLLSSEIDGDILCQPSLATDDFRRLPTLDLCLICVKEFDLAAALSQLRHVMKDDTILLPLLNGVDVCSRVRAVISRGIVLPACVYVGTHIERPGRVIQKGGACWILFGPDPHWPDFAPQEVLGLFERAGIRSDWTRNIQVEIWTKFIFISAYGLVSAAYDKTIGQILDDETLTSETKAITAEVIALARASGIPLADDVAEASLLKARGFPFEAKTSFQRDFERADKRDERDLFAGSIIKMGQKLRIDVPRTKAVAGILGTRKPVPQDA